MLLILFMFLTLKVLDDINCHLRRLFFTDVRKNKIKKSIYFMPLRNSTHHHCIFFPLVIEIYLFFKKGYFCIY